MKTIVKKSSDRKPTIKNASFAQRLLSLIAEPAFIKVENILSEPNFFKIVGRTHYERWHSAFFGWLLDPGGSHLLDDYVLRRMLLLLLDENCLQSQQHSEDLLTRILPLALLTNIQVSPNENAHTETSVVGIGRFDIFLTAQLPLSTGENRRLNIIFELKIDSKANHEQSTKYPDWLTENHPEDINLLIYVTPRLLHDSKSTVGDERWYCLNYQMINDKILFPLLDHPNLNEKVKPFIIQYVKNLKVRYRGIKMAITDEEKRLAVALYEKYSDVFDSIYDALVSTGTIDFSTSDIIENKGRNSGKIAVRFDKKAFTNKNVRLLFTDLLAYMVENDLLTKIPLPWGSSKHRYIVTNQQPAVHPNDRPFFYPVSYRDYTIETHYAIDRALKVLSDLSEQLDVEFEAIET